MNNRVDLNLINHIEHVSITASKYIYICVCNLTLYITHMYALSTGIFYPPPQNTLLTGILYHYEYS